MPAHPGVTARGASLLQADPALARLLGARAAAAAGDEAVLPVLSVPAGPWTVPSATALGEGTVALVVLAGALLRRPPGGQARLFGPGEVLEPWTHGPAGWSACASVRAAVIGKAFQAAVRPWPRAVAHMLRRAADVDGRAGLPVRRAGGTGPQDRLGELLWRLALRWGRIEGDAIALPLALPPAALAELTALTADEVATGLRALDRAGVARPSRDGTWLLRGAGRGRPGDRLCARAVAELSRAREERDTCAGLIAEAGAHIRRGEERRAG